VILSVGHHSQNPLDSKSNYAVVILELCNGNVYFISSKSNLISCGLYIFVWIVM
jgi:hypothetical protein